MTKQRASEPTECQACHKMIDIGQVIVRHHTSYFPEVIINVHRSCHSRIHVGHTMYQELRPDQRQMIRWYKKLNHNYRNHTEANEYVIQLFFDSIDFGFFTPEVVEKIKELQVKEYWQEVDRIQKIREKLNIKVTWSSCD